MVIMKTFKNLFQKVYSINNLYDAYEKASKNKSNSSQVIEFTKNLKRNISFLCKDIREKTYEPKPLQTFILRDPKTRKISVSAFVDRVMHHAIVNVLQEIFEPRFILDSYGSRKGKGVLPAINRFYEFMRKVTMNGKLIDNAKNKNQVIGYVLKCDIYHYFETVDHEILINIISKYVDDKDLMWLIKKVLKNYHSEKRGTGMPLGNWTSQFFANVYLNELDYFAKYHLKAKYYIRYVDDFVILGNSKKYLLNCQKEISEFLETKLKLRLHTDKSKIVPLSEGVSFLGFRLFYKYKL